MNGPDLPRFDVLVCGLFVRSLVKLLELDFWDIHDAFESVHFARVPKIRGRNRLQYQAPKRGSLEDFILSRVVPVG